MRKQSLLQFILIFLFLNPLFSQSPTKYTSADIQQLLKKLDVLGTVLYVAAHPDDENTAMISYYANEEMMRTAYFSVTRGDGGQNLIGTEMSELLGLIRTQELLAARRVDGGEQFFSRANDFGFSKDPDETFNIWDKKAVLSDMVLAIRKFRPDIIITRFSLEPGITHGHHTASAMLANEAFDIAANPEIYPEHLTVAKTWQPQRIFWNTSWWFYQNTGRKMDTTGLVAVNVGTYNANLGKSYTEISALSRSMHKSQGFGSTGSRGDQPEYLMQWKGTKATKTPFDGINTTWSRVVGGEKVAEFTSKAKNDFDASKPYLIVPHLINALKATDQLQDEFWKEIKRKELQTLIKACLGLYIEAKTSATSIVAGDSLELSLEAINRSPIDIQLSNINITNTTAKPVTINTQLDQNKEFKTEIKAATSTGTSFSQPYWLVKNGSIGMYAVDDQHLINRPENEPAFKANFDISIDGYNLSYETPVVFKKNDPVDGEVFEPFVVTPPVFMNITEKVYVMNNIQPRPIKVKVIAAKDNLSGTVSLKLPSGWSSTPSNVPFALNSKDQELELIFMVTPPKNQSEGDVQAIATIDGNEFSNSLTIIDYDHIPKQKLFFPATAKVVNIDLKIAGSKVGYIMGAGDDIPASLRQIGYDVKELTDDDINLKTLASFDAVIMGVRAYNTLPRLKQHQSKLMEYVNNGGTLIVQYNTNRPLMTDEFSPYPISLSRDRVTVEDAEVRILAPTHPLMNFPNKITADDFKGWVQERGLYFPDKWDEKYTAVLSSNDPGETPKDGGLLVAKYGKGNYIYTGYSWFRELPSGVSGAYRIFANMVSIGKNPKQ
uniref:PIG-L family deacetylase n=1 Tax=Fulvivirga sp. TaxID=1931237 RepID=UPI00404B1401